MAESKNNTSQIRFLLTSLGIIFVFILTLLVILSAYPVFLAPPPTDTPTVTLTFRPTASITPTPTITLTPTITRTPRPTFTPTVTLTPTRTSSPTPTASPTGPPTLTPDSPAAGQVTYSFKPWSPEDADYLITLLEYYPNTLTRQQRGEADGNYFSAFQFVNVSLSEALLRFPEATQAPRWRMMQAYNLARVGDQGTGQAYAELIAQALNRRQVEVKDLEKWFRKQESRLGISITLLEPLPGYLSGRLAQLDGNGGASLLLLETSSGFQAYALNSDFDFIHKPQYKSFTADLTDDGIQEIVIYQVSQNETRELALPRIFSLAKIPPQELPYHPVTAPFNVGMDYSAEWAAISKQNGKRDLQTRAKLFPACPLEIFRTYHWDGKFFNPIETTYTVESKPATISFCRLLVDHAISVWGPEAANQIIQTILPDWPPDEDPVDTKDEWRYRLGINYSLLGEQDEAVKALQELVDTPTSPKSKWIAPAQSFLNQYRASKDVYRACIQSTVCDPGLALVNIVASLQRGDYPQVLSMLGEAGVSLRASGYFDLDGDDTREVWFTTRHRPGEKLQAWVLADYTDGIKALPLGELDTNTPNFSYYDQKQLPPVVLINNIQAVRMQRIPDTLEPYLTYFELPKFYPDRFKEAYKAAMQALLDGGEPGEIYKILRDLEKFPGLLCRSTWSCDEYYYILGLSAELAGDRPNAISTFVQLWRDYSRSPFTTMARLKLAGVPATQTPAPPTPTSPTSTPTPVGALTPTSTLTGTPPPSTPTPTSPSGQGTPYPEPSQIINPPYP